MNRLPRTGEAVASGLTFGLAVGAAVGADAGRPVMASLIALAIAWSGLPLVAHLLGRPVTASGPIGDRTATSDQTVTTVIRFRDEPLDVARTSILLALQAGPTIVIAAAGTAGDEIRRLGAVVIEADQFHEGLASALVLVTTPGVLITSARAVPVTDECRAAGAELADGLGWIAGTTEPFNTDAYVRDTREAVSAVLRQDARRAGLVAWEPDATIVATDLLRHHPLTADRPLGEWLRARSAEGHTGRTTDEVLTRRAAPVDAAAYWPDAVARHWGRVADLSGALRSGPARLQAAGLLARELFAVPTLVWLSAPLWVGRSRGNLPVDVAPVPAFVLVVGIGLCRWLAVRQAVGRPARPWRDLAAAAHHLPGSLAGLVPLATRRMPRGRLNLPARPLVWGALVLTLTTGLRLIDGSANGATNTTVALALLTLGALWVLNMGSLAQRDWARSSYRIPLDLAIDVDGVAVRTVNGSPSGLALQQPSEGPRLDPGERVRVRIDLDDGSNVVSLARVAGTRTVRGRKIVGLSLTLGDGSRRRWAAQLQRASSAARLRPAPPRPGLLGPVLIAGVRGPDPELVDPDAPTPLGVVRRVTDRLVVVTAAVVSLAVAAVLVLLMFGIEPLVIRSGSMEPTLSIGDVVLSEKVSAADLEVGDIATVPYGDETLTHRVRALTDTPDGLAVATRGDANSTGELITLAPASVVGRQRWTIPLIGRPATAIRTSTAELIAAIVALGLLVGAVLRRPRQ